MGGSACVSVERWDKSVLAMLFSSGRGDSCGCELYCHWSPIPLHWTHVVSPVCVGVNLKCDWSTCLCIKASLLLNPGEKTNGFIVEYYGLPFPGGNNWVSVWSGWRAGLVISYPVINHAQWKHYASNYNAYLNKKTLLRIVKVAPCRQQCWHKAPPIFSHQNLFRSNSERETCLRWPNML